MWYINKYGTYIFKGEQRSENWLKARKNRLTASTVAAACGRSIYKDIQSLGEEIVYSITSERTIGMKRGTKYENSIRKYYETEYNCIVNEIGFAFKPSRPHFGVSPDGLIEEEGLIEIKCPATMYKELIDPEVKYSDTDQPLHIKNDHYDQMQAQMAIMDRLWCDYIVYSPEDNSVYIERVNFNKKHWDMLSTRIDSFIDTYLKDLEVYIPKL